jgi:hypothetical protein
MQNYLPASPTHLLHLIVELRARVRDPLFRAAHRRRPVDFTRERTLPFLVVLLVILQKTTKSVQRHLHEFLAQWFAQGDTPAVTPGGWTQARAKLQHTAFIELDQQVLLPHFYAPEQAAQRRTWRGHRALGVDGSEARLPRSQELATHFGEVKVTNQHGATGTSYPAAAFSVLYDLLNHVGLDARLEPHTRSEVDVALEQVVVLQPDDVLIWDRGFTGFRLMAAVRARGAHFIGRCSRASFLAAQELFRLNRAGRSVVTKVYAPADERAELQRLGLPTELLVRFVSVRLSTGELEVLVTSLLDEAAYPTEEFLEVYHWRWGHETYHQRLKGRLDLEHWSGETVEAVRQDFFAAVLLANLETLLQGPAQAHLTQVSGARRHKAQVNRANSYHALKTRLVELLASDEPVEEVLRRLQQWLVGSPVAVRPGRTVPRRPVSMHRSYHYQRHVRKTVY